MFSNGFPKEWSTLRKLAWLYRTVINAVSAVLKTIIGNPIHITDALAKPVQALSIALEPIQDLHGYDSPWPAGGGKNLLNAGNVSITASVQTQYNISSDITLAAGTYTLSWTLNKTVTATRNRPLYHISNTGTDVYANADYLSAGRGSWTFTLESETTLILRWWAHTVSEACVLSDFQLELGSTATSYAPYSNICPISGHTDADVVRTGVNVWDEEWEVGIYKWETGLPYESTTRIRSKNKIPVISGKTYYIKQGGNNVDVYCYYADGSYEGGHYLAGTGNGQFTIPDGVTKINFSMYASYGTTYNHDISINYPSTDHDYHAYVGTTYPLPLGQTVYGGTLDVVTGVLTVTMAMVDMGTLTWNSWGQGGSRIFRASISEKKPTRIDPCLCSIYTYNASIVSFWDALLDKQITGQRGGTNVYVRDTTYSDDASFKAAMSGVQLVYELASPQTIQLTPQQVELLQGENNIWSDGEMTLVYLADGNASDVEALNILLGGRYVNNHTEDEPTDREALNIILGGNER